MAQRHLDPKVLERVLRGEATAGDARELLLHLAESCPDCARALDVDAALVGSLPSASQVFTADSASATGASEHDRVFENVLSRLRVTMELVENERHEAPALAAELLRHPLARQRLMVHNTSRFWSLPVAELLLEQAWKKGFDTAADADAQAEVALELIDKIEPAPSCSVELMEDVRARGWALRGNFQRIQGDLRASEASFGKARDHLRRGTGDLLERARLVTLESTLRRQQARRELATELLAEAIKIYRLVDDPHLVGRTMINQALLLHEQGEVEQAIDVLREAQKLVEPGREPHLARVMQHNLVGYLSELGRFEEAMRLIPSLRHQMIQHGTPVELLRLRWQEAKIHLGLGKFVRAEAALTEVRRGFLERDLSYDVAAVSLELAALYMRQRRTAEIRELASQMFPIFQSRDLHQQAIAALLLFQRAVEMDTLTLRMVEEVADVVRRSQEKPRPQTPEPS